jgi:SAM-dependent methyltransferase
MQENLTQRETHFAFGKNWAAYAEKVTEAEISEAERGLMRLLGETQLSGKRFLDIGCGSGIHALAALRLGAREVIAVDLDPDSVATTRAMLEQHALEGAVFRVEEASIFDLRPERMGAFDIVYSWGVCIILGIWSVRYALQQQWWGPADALYLPCIGGYGWMLSGVGKNAGMRMRLLRHSAGLVQSTLSCFVCACG